MPAKPQHAQEKRTMRSSRPARLIAALRRNITTVRENVPVMALAGIAFGASYGHISKLCGEHGQHGWVQYASARGVDLLCIMGAEERRGISVSRARAGAVVSWPAIVLVIGHCLLTRLVYRYGGKKASRAISVEQRTHRRVRCCWPFDPRAAHLACDGTGGGQYRTGIGQAAAGERVLVLPVPRRCPAPVPEAVRVIGTPAVPVRRTAEPVRADLRRSSGRGPRLPRRARRSG